MGQAPRLAPGSIFARDYKIIDLLAEGGMGAVYRAEQLSTRKLRALKLVTTRLASDPKGRERFVREATVGASIDSEHAVEVIGAGIDEDTGRPWLAMELLDGADLGAVLRHQGPMSPGQWREVMGQLCHGLASAHRAGVVHRDLKPANVFVARSRRAGVPFTIKILDFGIAKVVQESGSGATETDTVGSPLWMAPEQLNAQQPTPATDVWALGLLAFWALTGKHYWIAAHAEASTVQALFVEQLFKPLATPTERTLELDARIELPPGFDEWFLRCTNRDPPQRYSDASAASEALLTLLAPDPEAAARLLPEQNLPPSISQATQDIDAESTQATQSTGWEASAVVPASTLAAARSSFEGAATRLDAPGLGADLSSAPLPPPGPPASRSGASPFAVMLSVAAVVGVMFGGGYLAWSWQAQRTGEPTAKALVATSDSEAVLPDRGTYGAGDDASGDAPTAGTDTEPTPDPGSRDPLLGLVVPMRTQLDRKVHEFLFLGWSESGHRFALKAEHRADRKGENNRLTLIQVHDALTGLMVDSYVVSRDAAEGTSRYHALSKANAEARLQVDWEEQRTILGLNKRGPSRERPSGGQLIVRAGDAPPGTSLSLPPSALGMAFRWTSRVDPTETEPNPSAPVLSMSFDHEGKRSPVLRVEPPFSQRELAQLRTEGMGGEDPALVGRVLAFWSPDGTRVFLQVESESMPAGEGSRTHRRWALRAAGPQIRLVEAGAGQLRTRQVAAQLAAAGLPVAVTELRAPPMAESQLIRVRKREGAEALALRVRQILPELPEPEGQRRKRDFAAVVIMLGHDHYE